MFIKVMSRVELESEFYLAVKESSMPHIILSTTSNRANPIVSIKEAAEFYSIKANSIGMVCNKQRKTAGGYRWEYLERCSNTRKKRDKNIIRKISANNAQKRKVINTDTREIFESIREASKCINIPPSNINNVCRGKRKLAGGYRWAYYTEITEL